MLQKQYEKNRPSSYVKPQVLQEARKIHSNNIRRKKDVTEETEVDIDIETVDSSTSTFQGGDDHVKIKLRRGRKPGRKVLECEMCGYTTTHSGHMKIHILSVHKAVKTLQCKYNGCNYKCARKGSMTRHEKCVHRKDEKFKCELCDFESVWNASLERHIVTQHEKLKPWMCELCDKSFAQQYSLKLHMNIWHDRVKMIECDFCSFRSMRKPSVQKHMVKKHKEQIESQAMKMNK